MKATPFKIPILFPPAPGVPRRPPPTALSPALSDFSPLPGLCQFYMPRDCVTIAHSCSPDTAQVPGDAQHVSGKGKHLETCLDSSGYFPRMFPAADLQPPPSGKVKASSGLQTQGLLFSPTVICYKPRQCEADHLGCIMQNGIMCTIFGVGCMAGLRSGEP